ncbi:MAG: tetratricopeptide repeat protein [Candidatus Poribacteria bacterium]|nr:tetratricopeptide repeat protein [Candidatus Poribacteria bacterium]
MKQNNFPPGWDEERVQKVIAYYENQTEDEAVAEDEEAFRNESMNDRSDSQNELNRVLGKIQEIVEKSTDGDYIYRGEPEEYKEHPYHGKVSSSLYRSSLTDSVMEEGIEEYRKVIESQIGNMEKGILESAKEYLYEAGSETISDFEILAQLQHYGCKTNLIDFTTDYLIALFFACDRSYHKDGRVILQKRESEDYKVENPSEAIKRVESQKSVLIRSSKGFINPDVVVVIPKELKLPVLNYLEKYHDISTKKIYKDIHGFIKWLGGYFDPMLEYGKGVSCQNRAGLENNMQEKLKWYEKAYEHFTEALKLKSDFTEVYIHRGAVFRDVDQFDPALKDFNVAIEVAPEFPSAYNERGRCYAKIGDTEKALNDFNIAIDLDSEKADFYNNRGITYKDMEEVDLAIQDYSKAIELDPEFPEAYNNLGVIYDEKGEHDKAIDYYSKAIDLRSYYANAYKNRGKAYRDKGDTVHAIFDFSYAILLKPDDAITYYSRGEALLRMERWKEARADLKKSNDKGVDIIALFYNDYESIEDFEQKNNVKLPEDLAAMLNQQ